MDRTKRIAAITLFVWFIGVIVFLSAWNADRFVYMMEKDLPGIRPDIAKWRTDSWDTSYTEYFRFKEPLAEVTGASLIALDKKSVDNYGYIKDGKGNMQLVEDPYDRTLAVEKMLVIARAFEKRGIPLVYVSPPPRFDKEEFRVACDLDFYGQREEQMLGAFDSAGVDTIDAGEALKAAGLPYLYPFKTDIHMRTEGEIETARLIAEKLASLDIEIKESGVIFDMENYSSATYGFTGNLVKSSGAVYADGEDSFELLYPEFNTDLTVENPGGKVNVQGPFSETVMNGMEKPENLAKDASPYWVLNYLQYPSGYYTIDNNLNKGGSRLLFLIDSYMMRAVAYMSLGAGHISVIDPRGEGGAEALAQAIESGEFDAVIIAGGGRDFYIGICELEL